jgi:phosphoribosylanthranilate isomerase
MTEIKICGIRSLPDALWAIQAGAWAVGFIFAPSPRRIGLEQAAAIIRALPAAVHKVGVFVDADRSAVQGIISATGIDMLQFHGAESPEYCQEWELPVIKSFRVRDENSLTGIEQYQVFAHLFDTYVPGSPGGSGRSFDWRYLNHLPPELRIILAGGLHPKNVAAAIQQTHPFAVDVSSGVEIDGRKDRHLIEDFICNVRATDAGDNLAVS